MFWLLKFAKKGGDLKGAIREFFTMNGRMPSSAEANKMEAIIKNAQSNVIQLPKQKSSLAELLRTGVVKRGVAPKQHQNQLLTLDFKLKKKELKVLENLKLEQKQNWKEKVNKELITLL